MASTSLDLPILISQLPNMQQIAGSHIIPQDAQQALFSQMVADHRRVDDQKVQLLCRQERSPNQRLTSSRAGVTRPNASDTAWNSLTEQLYQNGPY